MVKVLEIVEWLKRCFGLLKNPFEVFKPDVSDTVVSDDTGVRLNGEKALIWGQYAPIPGSLYHRG